MYVMGWNIRIGRYRLRTIESVNIRHSVETLSDMAEIVLPATVFNKAIDVEDKLSIGDDVEICLGYDNDLMTEFKGYLKSIKTDDGSLTLECEDGIYLWDHAVNDTEYKEITLQDLLSDVAAQIDPAFVVDCKFDYTYDTFTTFHTTGHEVLKKVQEETKANIYFTGGTLHVMPQYAETSGRTVVFDFARNIERAELKYRSMKDRDLEVQVVLNLPDGTNVEKKVGKSGGKSIKRVVSGVSKTQLNAIAENEYNSLCYNGYEGWFTGWLVPFVEPGDVVWLIDADYEYKEGKYYVLATEIDFSREGGKRNVSLGRKVNG